jgi:hypothetical protein
MKEAGEEGSTQMGSFIMPRAVMDLEALLLNTRMSL